MKKVSAFLLVSIFLSLAATACRNVYSWNFSKKYNCRIAGENDPVTAQDFVQRGTKHALDEGNFECGFDACSEALRLDDKNAPAYACRGYMYYARREFDLAMQDYDMAIRLDQTNHSAFYNRGKLFQLQHQYGKALEDMNTVIKLTAGNELQHHNYHARSQVYVEMGDYENALNDATQAIRLQPDYKYHYDYRAEIYRKLNKPDLAEADTDKFNELELIENNRNVDNNSGKKPRTDIVLNKYVIAQPQPVYPPSAKAANAGGEVKVQVQVDKTGTVTFAKTISGHPLLQVAAAQAARKAKLRPVVADGEPINITGIIIYNFPTGQSEPANEIIR